MSHRVLVVEPDPSGRAMMDRVLAAEGYVVSAVGSVEEALPLLDAATIDLAIVELAGVRLLRSEHPTLAVIATGTLLSQQVLLTLLRLGALDALAKPFTPDELRRVVAAGLKRGARREDALEYAAAIRAAHRAVGAGELASARKALCRAAATSPLDAEVMAMVALVAELEGHDEDADRGYRASLALRREEDACPPDPHEGLARLAAYAGAGPAASLPPRGTPIWLVSEPVAELGAPPSGGPLVVLLAVGLDVPPGSFVHWRAGAGPRRFALLPGAMRVEAVAMILPRLGGGPLLAGELTRARLDVPRLEAPRRA